MDKITIKVDNAAAKTWLKTLAGKIDDLSPALKVIGEYMLVSTDRRFTNQGPAPDGKAWAPLKPSTLARKKIKKILTETSHLRGSIRYQLQGKTAVAIGTNKVYAAIHQLGGTVSHRARAAVVHFRKYAGGKNKGKVLFSKASKATFAQKIMKGGYTATIPARPFLGISDSDTIKISKIVNLFLDKK